MSLFFRKPGTADEERSAFPAMGFNEYLRLVQSQFSFNGNTYAIGNASTVARAEAAYDGNAPVFSLIAVRSLVFSEVRFQFQRYRDGRPGDLFGTSALSILEQPWLGATTGDLLARMELDASIFGNSYWVVENGQLVRLDPRHVTLMLGDHIEPLTGQRVGRSLLGYMFNDSNDPNAPGVVYDAGQVAHYKPLAGPGEFTGRSWVASVLPDVAADDQITTYKHAFLRNSATPNMIVSFDAGVSPEQFSQFKATMDANHAGATNAFKTLYLGGGADVKVVGQNFEQLALRATQGAGETRLAAAAGVPASIVGFSEGLAGSALNSGNYTAARRRFADGTMRPLWRAACGALQTLVTPPGADARLWYDDRDVSFLQEDVKDSADIKATEANTIESLIRAGFRPDSVVAAVTTGDYTALSHTGLYSVQLQAPGTSTPIPARSVPVDQLALPLAPG
jgi:hypothetical protein